MITNKQATRDLKPKLIDRVRHFIKGLSRKGEDLVAFLLVAFIGLAALLVICWPVVFWVLLLVNGFNQLHTGIHWDQDGVHHEFKI